MSTSIDVTLFTDPACPFAFSHEPVRRCLEWAYGDQLTWYLRLIVLTDEPREATMLAEGAPGLQARYGMPIDPVPYPREFSSEPACRAVVAARLHQPGAEWPLLRRLRVRAFGGGLLDDPELLRSAAVEAGIDPLALQTWVSNEDVHGALAQDMRAARSPSVVARALNHRLGGPADARRYSAPSYEFAVAQGGATASVPGFNPIETYEIALANLMPELVRRDPPTRVEEVLEWATEPLATAEFVGLLRQDEAQVRAALGRAAAPIPVGADSYWVAP